MSLPEQFMNAEFQRTFDALAKKQKMFADNLDTRHEIAQRRLDELHAEIDKGQFRIISMKEKLISEIIEHKAELQKKINMLNNSIENITQIKLDKIRSICNMLNNYGEDNG